MIPLFKVAMNPEASKAVEKVLLSGFIGQGEVVEEFERQLKQSFNNSYLITVNSGTSALHLALRLIKDKHPEKKYIISTALTCTATNWAILAAGFEIIWADIDPNTLNICPESVLKLTLEEKTYYEIAAVMVVHWGGAAADVKKIKSLTGLDIIEDCAHAFGSYYELPATKDESTLVGNSGNYCCFSFQAIKHLTTGDGGMLILPNEEEYKKAKLLRWYGIDREGDRKDFRCEAPINDWGYKFHMNDINAAIGIENLKIFGDNVRRHQNNAGFYDWWLNENSRHITPLYYDEGSSYWIYSILVEDRDNFQRAMKDRGVMTSQVHERNDLHPCVKEFKKELPNVEQVIGKLSSLPVGWWVTDKDREYIVEQIKKGW
jgi:dTDP-4-amino-4,6-dideoxygalactose transaminase